LIKPGGADTLPSNTLNYQRDRAGDAARQVFAKGIVTIWPGLQARCAEHIEPGLPTAMWARLLQ